MLNRMFESTFSMASVSVIAKTESKSFLFKDHSSTAAVFFKKISLLLKVSLNGLSFQNICFLVAMLFGAMKIYLQATISISASVGKIC